MNSGFPSLPRIAAARVLFSCVLFCGLAAPGLTSAAFADAGAVVEVTMWDKGANAEMAMDKGMGMAHDPMMGGMMPGMTDGSMGMKLSTDSVPAGEVTFKVSNTSKDQVHEMLVLPWPADGKGQDQGRPREARRRQWRKTHRAEYTGTGRAARAPRTARLFGIRCAAPYTPPAVPGSLCGTPFRLPAPRAPAALARPPGEKAFY